MEEIRRSDSVCSTPLFIRFTEPIASAMANSGRQLQRDKFAPPHSITLSVMEFRDSSGSPSTADNL
jgi:hypothetical protein